MQELRATSAFSFSNSLSESLFEEPQAVSPKMHNVTNIFLIMFIPFPFSIAHVLGLYA